MTELRAAGPDDQPLLWDMLYEALWVQPGRPRPGRSVLEQPDLAHYVAGFGDRPGDVGVVAHRDDGVALGAAWSRVLAGDDRGYGWVDDHTPEVSIALTPDARGRGVGTLLMLTLLDELRADYPQVSLSVDPDNPAKRLYDRLGFTAVGHVDTSITMVARTRRPRCVLLDFDGVIRHFDEDASTRAEQRHDLEPGALTRAAYHPDLLQPVITGKTTRAQWVVQIGEAVGSPDAAAEWLTQRGVIDEEMLAIVDGLRAAGVVVAVLSNGTDTLAAEFAEFGIDDRFDAVFSTADIGYAKPDPRAFRAVVDALGVDPEEVLFTDDSPSKLPGAITVGMSATHFVDNDGFRLLLRARGL